VTTYTVKDLMVPLSEYATVSEDASLYEAVVSLEKAQEEFSTQLEKAPGEFSAPKGIRTGRFWFWIKTARWLEKSASWMR
jgi:hypothetical protein